MRKYLLLLALVLCGVSVAQENVKITHFGVEDGLMDHTVSYGMQDSFGYIWFGTHNGLVRYDGYRFITYKAQPGDKSPLTTNRIDYVEELPDHDLRCLSQHTYYVFHRSSGTFEYAGKEETEEKHHEQVGQRERQLIEALEEYRNVDHKLRLTDRQGGVWVRSSRGLERVVFTRRPVGTVKFAPDEGEEYVRGLMIDRQKRLWVTDKNQYVRVFSQQGGLSNPLCLSPAGQLTAAKTAFGHDVFTVFEDSRGRIWLGTKPSGLFLLIPDGRGGYAMTHFENDIRDAYSFSGSSIYDIIEDEQHRIWIGSYGGGLNMVEDVDGVPRRFINQNNLLKQYPKEVGRYVRCLKRQGNLLLIGTTDGLVTTRMAANPSAMKFYVSQRDSADAATLSNNCVMSIEADSRGRVFLATHGGGICMANSAEMLTDNIKFRTLSSQNGLPSDVCLNVFLDCNQQVWVESEYTLSQINADEGTFTNYQQSLFSGGFLFSEAHPLCLPDGRLIFGTTQGLLQFDIDDIRKSSFVPPIVFELIRETAAGNKSPRYAAVPCPDRLELKPREKNFTLRFAALDYNKNERILYAYRLEGIDDTWHYTIENQIVYTSFPAGTYRLHVKSTNGDGLWVDNERVITIHRRAAFNETRYAWMLYGILLLLLLLLVYYVAKYIRQLQKEMSDYRLATSEKMEYMEIRMQEMLSRSEARAPAPENAPAAEPAAASAPAEMSMAESETAAESDASSDDYLFKQKVEQYLTEQMSNSDLTVDDLARQMYMSRSLLYLRVKKVFGVSPNNLIQNMRIQHAMQLMRRPDATIAGVAFSCGFSDPKYFSRCFKKATGQTPTEYREAGN